jgi:uncharacterized protein (DUF1810 family)
METAQSRFRSFRRRTSASSRRWMPTTMAPLASRKCRLSCVGTSRSASPSCRLGAQTPTASRATTSSRNYAGWPSRRESRTTTSRRRRGITDLDQAKRYLADSILGARLRQVVTIMACHHGKSAYEILGSPDDLKFRSCLTLFREAAADHSDRALFTQALDEFYGGQPDDTILALLR